MYNEQLGVFEVSCVFRFSNQGIICEGTLSDLFPTVFPFV